MLNVNIDLIRGAYILSRNNGEEVVIKAINENGTKSYKSKEMKKRRQEIVEGITYVATDRKREIDPVLYDALKEFDTLYGTDYSTSYRDITLESIPFKMLSEKNRDRKKRGKEYKTDLLKKAGISSIEYNLSLFNASKNLSMFDRIKLIKLAFSQRLNGINIRMIKSQTELPEALQPQIAEQATIPESNQQTKMQSENEEEKEEEIASEEKKDETIIVHSQAPANQVRQDEALKPEAQTEQEQDTKQKSREEIKAKRDKKKQRKLQRKQQGQTESQKISRRKTIQESKKIARAQAKTSYQDRIRLAEEKRAINEKMRIEAAKRAEQQAILDKQEQERIEKERQAAKAAKIAEQAAKKAEQQAREEENRKVVVTPRIRRILAGKDTSETGETVVTRFTRKLKNQRDAIQNKIRNMNATTKKKFLLGSAVGSVAVIAAAVLMLNSEAIIEQTNNGLDSIPPAQSVEVLKPSSQESAQPSLDYTYESPTEQEQPSQTDDTESQQPSYVNPIENDETTSSIGSGTIYEDETDTEDMTVSGEEGDSSKEYLSSIKVGTAMNIQEGQYYTNPDGTGNFGHFENYQSGTKRITIIGVATDKGYFSIDDPHITLDELRQRYPNFDFHEWKEDYSEITLYELKQEYPDAKFSYHFISENKDGTTTQLGWLTEKSIQNENSIQTESTTSTTKEADDYER